MKSIPKKFLSLILVLAFVGMLFTGMLFLINEAKSISNVEVQISPVNGLTIKIDKEIEAPAK